PPKHARAALHAKVSQLRRVLEEAEPGARELVALQDGGYLLGAMRDDVDAWRFLDLVRVARDHGAPRDGRRSSQKRSTCGGDPPTPTVKTNRSSALPSGVWTRSE